MIWDFSQLQTEVQLPKSTGLYRERKWGCTAKWLSTISLLIVIFDKQLCPADYWAETENERIEMETGKKRRMVDRNRVRIEMEN